MIAQTQARFPVTIGRRSVALLLLAALVLFATGARLRVDRILAPDRSSATALIGSLIPPQLAERRETAQIADFDPTRLPPFARLETVRRDGRSTQWLVEPFGYVVEVAGKLIETLEIALSGAIIAVAIGLPLSAAGAANLTHRRTARAAARGLIAVLRAVPELVSALFLVAAYGFGPLAGVLALGLHGAGFLGKFYADEMENADPAPQEALATMGLPRLIVWRHAILPQVMPQFAAFTLYILDRNVRMATVVGLVGAGGIGQELKGRFDMYQYDRVGTILLAIVMVVLAIDLAASRLRRQMLHG